MVDAKLLEEVGLNEAQARAYVSLISGGSLTPPQLAEKTGVTRTNAYEVLNKLVEMGLAIKDESGVKLNFRPSNPTALEKLIENRRNSILSQENRLHAVMPELLNYFYTYSEQPGVRFFQGREGLTKIYEDHLRTRQEVYFVRTPQDEDYFGDVLYKYMKQRAKLGIKAYGLSPWMQGFVDYARENDTALNRVMNWMPAASYKSPVEMSVYGDKVSLISFGDEALGMIIESPQIAEAMRELLKLAVVGGKTLLEMK